MDLIFCGTLFPASRIIPHGVLRTRIRFHHLLLFQQIPYRAIPPSPSNSPIGHPAPPHPGSGLRRLFSNSTLQNPAHTYSSAGNYTVTLTITNTYGNSTIQKPNYITVTPASTFLSGWSYRKLHTISGSASGDLTDYQVRFKVYNTTGTDIGENVYLGSNVKPDFSDIRFTTPDNTPIPYWIQETGSNYALVWVKVPSIPTTGTKMYLYYGNPFASSLCDGAATFLFFDHFAGTAVNTTRWTKSGDVTVAGSVATLNAPDEKSTSIPGLWGKHGARYPNLDGSLHLWPGRVWR